MAPHPPRCSVQNLGPRLSLLSPPTPHATCTLSCTPLPPPFSPSLAPELLLRSIHPYALGTSDTAGLPSPWDSPSLASRPPGQPCAGLPTALWTVYISMSQAASSELLLPCLRSPMTSLLPGVTFSTSWRCPDPSPSSRPCPLFVGA